MPIGERTAKLLEERGLDVELLFVAGGMRRAECSEALRVSSGRLDRACAFLQVSPPHGLAVLSSDTDPAALRAADSLAILPVDPLAAAEEIQRRREELGFSYFVFGAEVSDALAPVVAELAAT